MSITYKSPRAHDESQTRLAEVYDKLGGIDPEDLRDALLAITEGAPTQQWTRDRDDPGPELGVGEGGVVEVEDLSDLERVVGQNNQLPVHFLEEGVVTQKAVGRVRLKQAHSGLPAGSGWGTGSLVSRSLFLTNNHVIPDAAFARNTVTAEFNFQFDFNGTALGSDIYHFAPDNFFRTNAALDYTVVRIAAKSPLVVQDPPPVVLQPNGESGGQSDGQTNSEVDPDLPLIPLPRPAWWWKRVPGDFWGFLRMPAGPVAYAVGQFLNVIGHPSGRRKEIALQENTITHIFNDVIRYTTDTEPGSSGSPVFTNGWDIVALHHAGGDQAPNGQWLNNEGMRMDRIVADLRANVPAAIQTELGI